MIRCASLATVSRKVVVVTIPVNRVQTQRNVYRTTVSTASVVAVQSAMSHTNATVRALQARANSRMVSLASPTTYCARRVIAPPDSAAIVRVPMVDVIYSKALVNVETI